jgi:hypothetical protein
VQAEEIDVALDELENRLDRLRSLYEQYFLGIEKIEPSVARKDVDRRFWLLRRTQIRNTARRFRLQVLVQRYNTFQQYWARICREIENGTYSRHLLRAQKNLGEEPKTWAAKKRLGYFRRRDEDENGRGSDRPSSGEDLGALLDGPMDLDAEAARAAEEALRSADARSREPRPGSDGLPAQVAAQAGATKASTGPARLEMLDLDLDDGLPPAAPPVRSMPRPIVASAPVGAPVVSAPQGPAPVRPQSAPLPRPAAPTSQVPRRPPPAVAVARPPTETETRPEPAPPPQATTAVGGISDARLKQIHAEFAAAKRQARQTDAVSLDALAKSLRESEKRILAQHPGRTVDFHVVLKDGKPIVKPIVRK